jgi:tetratricopeptide (TPR) repeat protein
VARGIAPEQPVTARAPIEAPTLGGTRSLELDSSPAIERAPRPPTTLQGVYDPAQRKAVERATAGVARSPGERTSGAAQPAHAKPQQTAATQPARDRQARDKARSSRPVVAPPVPAPVRRRMTAAKLMLGTFGMLVACIGMLLGGAYAGLWRMPPSAAAMLGLDVTLRPLAAADRAGNARPEPPPSAAVDPESAPATSLKSAANAAASNKPPTEPSPTDTPATNAQTGVSPPSAPTSQAAIPEPTARTTATGPASATSRAHRAKPAAADPSASEPSAMPAAQQFEAAAATPSPSREKSAPVPSASEDALQGERLLMLARTKLQAHDPAAAESLLRRALARNPDDHHATEVLVRALIDLGRGPEAVQYAEQIVRKRPKRVSYRLLEGDAKRLAGDKLGAERAFREALQLEPGNREAKRRLEGS